IRNRDKVIGVPLHTFEMFAAKSADCKFKLMHVRQNGATQRRERIKNAAIGDRIGIDESDVRGGVDASSQFRESEHIIRTQEGYFEQRGTYCSTAAELGVEIPYRG